MDLPNLRVRCLGLRSFLSGSAEALFSFFQPFIDFLDTLAYDFRFFHACCFYTEFKTL